VFEKKKQNNITTINAYKKLTGIFVQPNTLINTMIRTLLLTYSEYQKKLIIF